MYDAAAHYSSDLSREAAGAPEEPIERQKRVQNQDLGAIGTEKLLSKANDRRENLAGHAQKTSHGWDLGERIGGKCKGKIDQRVCVRGDHGCAGRVGYAGCCGFGG